MMPTPSGELSPQAARPGLERNISVPVGIGAGGGGGGGGGNNREGQSIKERYGEKANRGREDRKEREVKSETIECHRRIYLSLSFSL